MPPEDRAPAPTGIGLDALYRAHASRLLRFFSRRSCKEDALDLVHDAFVRVARLDGPSAHAVEKPEAYLGRVATNLLRDRARLAARKAVEMHHSLDENRVAADDPHRLLEDRDRLARLETAVGRLNSRRRRIFLLHRLEGLSYAEIGDEVGMSTKGVKKQMAKALFELRRDMGPL